MGAGEGPQGKQGLAETFDLVIKGGTIVNHAGEGLADIGVRGGRIAAIGDLSEGRAGDTIDATGLHVLPGVIDGHGGLQANFGPVLHIQQPGGYLPIFSGGLL